MHASARRIRAAQHNLILSLIGIILDTHSHYNIHISDARVIQLCEFIGPAAAAHCSKIKEEKHIERESEHIHLILLNFMRASQIHIISAIRRTNV
jgi:hypothetical protein